MLNNNLRLTPHVADPKLPINTKHGNVQKPLLLESVMQNGYQYRNHCVFHID